MKLFADMFRKLNCHGGPERYVSLTEPPACMRCFFRDSSSPDLESISAYLTRSTSKASQTVLRYKSERCDGHGALVRDPPQHGCRPE